MKKSLLIAFIVLSILIIGCEELKEKREAKERKQRKLEYLETVQKEIQSNTRNDNIFMDFKLGDSKKQVNNKFSKLLKQKKIFLDDSKSYTYNLILSEDTKTTAHFSTEFHNGKLYKFVLIINPNKTSLPSRFSLFELMTYLDDIYEKKYGLCDHLELVDFGGGLNYYWINGNREISIIQRLNDINVVYLDKIVSSEIKNSKKQNNKTRLKETSSDI